MSGTNRGGDRHCSDYYVTPQQPIRDFLWKFLEYEPRLVNGIVLDPCAGGDKDHDMSYPAVLFEFGFNHDSIYTNDIREDSGANMKGDFLKEDYSTGYDLVITNPPFSHAMEFIEKSLEVVKEGGFVVMLLRLNFLESKKRFEFYKKFPPRFVFVHHERMSFTDDGKTDSVAYCHIVWQKGYKPDSTKLFII